MFRRQANTFLESALLAALADERKVSEERALIPGLVQHDLANVLCRVTLSASTLGRVTSEDERARVQREIESGLKLMGGLLTGLRCLYETSDGADDFARQDLGVFVGQLVHEVGVWPPGPPIICEGSPSLWSSFSPKLMRHALVNLIGNAVAYSQGSWVRVRISAVRGEKWQLSVANGGPGIPRSDLPYLFELQRRANGSAGSGSRGIGLYLARRCLAAQGMSLRVSSRPALTVFSFSVGSLQRSA
jgi:signal transduction histidine kinase